MAGSPKKLLIPVCMTKIYGWYKTFKCRILYYMRITNSLPPIYSQNPQNQPNRQQPGKDVSGVTTECKTCSSRKYKDISNDPSVSFQSPTHISPGQSAAMVSSHENEHVSSEKAKAAEEGREIISQTVTLSTAICPECKRVYISGGVTRTVIA